ncbi:MAG: carboxypeptidase-like regulatory domain-containing protein [Peptostreptococcaceae bacterium]|nr:carboxypeptidase-like regulatory domain-containing protein [Peptostreptococcaceae bacterium]
MKLFIQILLCFLTFFVSAQRSNINIVEDFDIKVNYDSTAFLNFVTTFEKEHPVKFYFNEFWLDKVLVRQIQTPTNLSQVLYDSFKDSNLNYFIDGSNILITKNYKIKTTLPGNFFRLEKNIVNNSSDSIELINSFFNRGKNEVPNLNNKIVYIGNPSNKSTGNKIVLSGIVRNEENGEPILGAQVYVKKQNTGTVTDDYGHYVITLPRGRNDILFNKV